MKRLIVGLGNPGKEYAGTRHNIGFAIVDGLAVQLGLSWQDKPAWCAQVATSTDLILVKPQTFMNDSGRAIRAVADFYKLDPTNVCVVVDDRDLIFGRMKFRDRIVTGAHHNGMRSIAKTYSRQVQRLRIGIGNDHMRHMPLQQFVLDKFGSDERAELPEVVREAGKLLLSHFELE